MERALERKVFGERLKADRVVYVALSPESFRGGKPSRYRAVLEVETPGGARRGRRELLSDGADCSELREPLTLVLTLMVDAELNQAALEQEPGAAGKQDSSAAPPPSRPPPERRPPSPPKERAPAADPSRLRFELGAGGRLGFGYLPKAAGAGSVELGLGVASSAGFIEARPGLAYWFPQESVDDGRGGRFRGWSFVGEVCIGRAEFALCPGVERLELTGEPVGLDFGGSSDLSASWGRLGFAWAPRLSSWLGVRIEGHAGVAFTRARFVYESASQAPILVHETPDLAAGMSLGVFFPIAP
ncbi:MAG: hypothetical protein H6718_00880 [Polyangiaceae bacterium]|nr:hypothetical protein [Polyangiaceae bacterium]MCB9607827.1 hypothetical protein [Polyangiaceae bacterium]